jgi:hypothetical protein
VREPVPLSVGKAPGAGQHVKKRAEEGAIGGAVARSYESNLKKGCVEKPGLA